MSRKYEQGLVSDLQNMKETVDINGVDVRIKKIPDCDIPGAMDPRSYAEMKKMLRMMRFMPKKMKTMDMSIEGLPKLRKMFNSVDSTPIVEDNTLIEKEFTIPASDGTALPMFSYQSKTSLENAPILYFIHGGGFFGGHSGVVREALRLLVANTNIVAFSIDYRLAPENPFPIGHDDCYKGLEWIHEHASEFGADSSNIFVAGDSAGGNLTLYCANRAIDEGVNLIKGQVILYPTVNMGQIDDKYARFDLNKFEVYEKHAEAINMSLTGFADAASGLGDFLGTTDIGQKYLTPYADVSSKMPPTLITVGEHDFLKIETLAYARKLVLAGVHTETIVYKGLGHAYIDKIGYLPQSEDFVLEMGRFILEQSGRL